jgi:AraC-like DNA-binding protein
MDTKLLLVAAIAFTFSQIFLSFTLLIRSTYAWSVQKSIYTCFLFAVMVYMLTPFVDSGSLRFWVIAIQTAIPGLFWLFSASLFDDHFRFRAWKIALVAITVLLPTFSNALSLVDTSVNRVIFHSIPQALEFVLMGFALIVITQKWKNDLVASRRQLRLWFCGLGGFYIIALLLMRELLLAEEHWLSAWQYVSVGGMFLIINVMALEYKEGLFHRSDLEDEGPQSAARIKAEPAATLTYDTEQEFGVSHAQEQGLEHNKIKGVPMELLAPLNQLMEQDFAYREMGFTIGQLANMLGMQEYRLRKLINAGLGYRNFNDFLNTYRIREARLRLSDPDEHATPVLNIALDAGYRSLSSFNKAFKDTLNQTPTEFRAAQLAL